MFLTNEERIFEELKNLAVNDAKLQGEVQSVRGEVKSVHQDVSALAQRFDDYIASQRERKADKHNGRIWGAIVGSLAIGLVNLVHTIFKS